jgi:hypothetical protein
MPHVEKTPVMRGDAVRHNKSTHVNDVNQKANSMPTQNTTWRMPFSERRAHMWRLETAPMPAERDLQIAIVAIIEADATATKSALRHFFQKASTPSIDLAIGKLLECGLLMERRMGAETIYCARPPQAWRAKTAQATRQAVQA